MSNHETLTSEQALSHVFDEARGRLGPRHYGFLERACALVKNGRVHQDAQGQWYAQRETDPEAYMVNGKCGCKEAVTAAEHLCTHRLAVGLVKMRNKLLTLGLPDPETVVDPPRTEEELLVDPVTADQKTGEVHDEGPQIDPRFVEVIRGKPFVQYRGLLAMATARGLCKLEARIDFQSAEIVYASATATFADGRIFTEAADATPQNVKDYVRPHFPRMALTRAKARCLRDALNIGLTCAEELEQ
jgi:hypothetical protein